MLAEGANAVNRPGFDIDALQAHLAGEPVSAPETDRIGVGG